MKLHRLLVGMLALTTFLLVTSPVMAAWGKKAAPTVEAAYPGMSWGPLRQAKLVSLPKGTVLKAGAITITEKQLAEEIAKEAPEIQAQLKKNQFFLLENFGGKMLTVAEARAWASAQNREEKDKDEETVMNAYFENVVSAAKVTDEEVQAFYDAHKAEMGDQTLDAVKEGIRGFLLGPKQQALVDENIQGLSVRTPIEISAKWMKAQAKLSQNNPVDKARKSGKPTLVDLGSAGCGDCDLLAPIITELQTSHGKLCNIINVNVMEEVILASRYDIQNIPTLIFFDKDGKEVFRHVGFMPKEDILAKLAELGVK